ncbi:MAG: rod-binding protein [Pseudomonadota bacterium]
MIFPVSSSPIASSSGADAKAETLTPEQAELRKAAEGFEAIMIRKWLQSARASNFAEETPLTGGGMKQFTQMRDEHFAEVASATGAFGFARSIEAQLSQHLTGHKD